MEWKKLAHAESVIDYTRDERTDQRIMLAQRIQTSAGKEVALLLADIAGLPDLQRLDPVSGTNQRRSVLAMIPAQEGETWMPDVNLRDAEGGITNAITCPDDHPAIINLLRKWWFLQSDQIDVGRYGDQKGAQMGVSHRESGLNMFNLSRRALTLNPRENLITLNDSRDEIYIARMGLWELPPQGGPHGLDLIVRPFQAASYRKANVVDALAKQDEISTGQFYGMHDRFGPIRRAYKRFLLDRAGNPRPEVASHWLGLRTEISKR